MAESAQAKKRIVGLIRAGSAVLTDDGIDIWRENGCEEWKPGAEEISHSLDQLGIPHSISTEVPRPAYRSRQRTPPRGTLVRIAREDFPSLKAAVPEMTFPRD